MSAASICHKKPSWPSSSWTSSLLTYVATKNDGKLKELREIFAGSELELDVYPKYREVEETALNYAANALLKALGLFEQLRDTGMKAAVLADDSGIEVDALDGRPGLYSARYAPGKTWPERLSQLLREVGDGRPEEQRGCKFVCAMALILPNGRNVEGYGEVAGVLTREPRGGNGFGYDPVFFHPPTGKTFGEITEEEKNRLSHRYNAAQSLLGALRAL